MRTRIRMRLTKTRPAPSIAFNLIEEPELLFGNEQKDVDPKHGLANFGPQTVSQPSRHPAQIKLGVVGSGDTIALAKAWIERCADTVGAIGEKKQFPDFPGFNLTNSPFKSEYLFDPSCEQILTVQEIQQILASTGDRRKRFEAALDLVTGRIKMVAEDYKPDVILVALPQEIYDACRSIGGPGDRSDLPKLTPAERMLLRLARRERQSRQMTLFPDLYKLDTDTQLIYRNFRRALKARVMRWGCPIQIVLPNTFFDERGFTEKEFIKARLKRLKIEEPASRAWNFCVGMYFKAGGTPWRLANVDSGTCFVGVSFYRHDTVTSPHMHSSLAQLFTDQGDATVIRGEKFEWDTARQGLTPHLTADHASNLANKVIETYRKYTRIKPRKIVIHKTSRFHLDERNGFEDGLREVDQRDLVAVYPRDIRCFREGEYPPIRGTCFIIGDGGHFIYTMGYAPFLDTYPRGHVPMPLEIVEHYGDSDKKTVCKDILALTKMNWNSSDHAESFPITIRFARLVGEIMSELPEGQDPHPSYRFYV